jgi:hypothetical protein
MLIRQMMGFLKEDDEAAAQADLANQSTQAAAAITQRATDCMHRRNACMREIIKNIQKSRKRHHSHWVSAHRQERPEPVMVQPVQQVDESQLTRSSTQEGQQPIVQSAVADQTPAQVPIAMLWLEREAAV